jgi:predicted phage terminase large subunit-like protein
MELYSKLRGIPRKAFLEWIFPSGCRVKMAHLEREETAYSYQGAQIPLLCVAKGTPVLMSDGSYKNIEDVKLWDAVQTLKGPRNVTKTFSPKIKECVRVETFDKNGNFLGDQYHPTDHPILTIFGWLSWDDLRLLVSPNSFSNQHRDHCKSYESEKNKFHTSLLFSLQTYLGDDVNSFFSEDGQNCFVKSCDAHQEAWKLQQLCVPSVLFSQRDNLKQHEFSHPYTKEVERASCVEIGSSFIVPFGPLEVYDITVEEQNHYITKSALCNKNCFDELTHFTENQLWYMSSRLRSVSRVSGYIRATCNPDADSFVRKIVDWYINCDGFPIPERSGVLRWYIRFDDEMIWADSRQELIDKYGIEQMPKSFTFIPSKLTDNKILMKVDPQYLSNLMALPRVEKMRLLEGNWDVRPQAGDYFQASWFKIVDALPGDPQRTVRFWDRAATEVSPTNLDPDSTSGTKMHKYANGTYVIENVVNIKEKPLNVERTILNTAKQDTARCRIVLEQEPGGSGVADVANYVRLLSGFDVRKVKAVTDKVTRALPFSAQCQAGNVMLLKGQWNDRFLKELENFPKGKHDDDVDSASGAFNELQEDASVLDLF